MLIGNVNGYIRSRKLTKTLSNQLIFIDRKNSFIN